MDKNKVLEQIMNRPIGIDLTRGYGSMSSALSSEEITQRAKDMLNDGKGLYSIIVNCWGGGSIYTIKLLRDLTGRSLPDCKKAVEQKSPTLFTNLDKTSATIILALLTEHQISAHIGKDEQ